MTHVEETNGRKRMLVHTLHYFFSYIPLKYKNFTTKKSKLNICISFKVRTVFFDSLDLQSLEIKIQCGTHHCG